MRLAADENFNRLIVRSLHERVESLDILSVQDAGRQGDDDPAVLQWAADENRVLLTHDKKTMVGYAIGRIQQQLFMPGLIVVHTNASIGLVTDHLEIVFTCSETAELANEIIYLPWD